MTSRDDDRARRLAAALRENLKRRKAQAREMRAGDAKQIAIAEVGRTLEKGHDD